MLRVDQMMVIRWRILAVLVLSFQFLGCTSGNVPRPPKGMTVINLEVTSDAFRPGDTIPKPHTGDGDNYSPPLSWSAPPAVAKTLALICDDPDAPDGTWVHWVLFNLPADNCELPGHVPSSEKLSNGSMHGKNDFGDLGYGGPAPPKGKVHRYIFKLYALDDSLDLKPGVTKADLLHAMDGHVLGYGELIGKYQR